jgi:hypothetical protein
MSSRQAESRSSGWHRLLTFRMFVVVVVTTPIVGVVGYYAARSTVRAIRRYERERRTAGWIVATKDQMQLVVNTTDGDSNLDERELAARSMIDRLLPDVPFVDVEGVPGTLGEYRGRVLVVSISSIGCPISQKLVPALARLPEKFRDGNVQFLVLNVDGAATQAEIEEHAKKFPNWRYVHDADDRVAGALAARTTCETFVVDQAQTLRYRGAVDDRFDIGVSRKDASDERLSDAIAAASSNRPVDPQVTDAPGCVLRYSPTEQPAVPVTWHNSISRLVQYNCVECHRPGEAGPFPLETYQQVVEKEAMIDYVLDEGLMPPWFADPRFGEWRNDRHVLDAEKELFRQWVAAGCPEGDPADAPAPLIRASGWTIGEPDLVLDVEEQDLPAEGELEWRLIPVDFEVKEDLWVSEAEIRPSRPELVHHAMLFIEYAQDDPRRETQTVGEAGATEGGTGFWLSFFPGRKSMILPPGRGKLIPKGGKIAIQLHYTPNGVATVDNTRIGLKLLPAKPEKVVVSGAVVNSELAIPPNSKTELYYGQTLEEDIRILAFMPHMHYRGAEAQVFLKHPDGRVDTLLSVPKYDFQWQVSYDFLEPLLAVRGSEIIIRHVYDNRAENPRNPDASVTVQAGKLTINEMMIGFFDWEPASDEPPPDLEDRPF